MENETRHLRGSRVVISEDTVQVVEEEMQQSCRSATTGTDGTAMEASLEGNRGGW